MEQLTTINEETISLYGTGKESRDFIYVLDLVKAIELVVQKATFKNDIINIANGIESSIKEVATCFYSLHNSNIIIKFRGEVRQGDPTNWVANISKLKTLGYKNAISINQGLNDYIQWLKESE